MTKQEPLKLWFIAIILVAFVSVWAVAGRSQNESADSIVPTVTATEPADNATAVALNQPITVTFSQQMSAPSISTCLIFQRPNGSLVSGHSQLLWQNRDLQAIDQSRAQYQVHRQSQTSGLGSRRRSLGQAFVWTFTTGTAIDSTDPTVTSTNPANAAVNVPTNQRILAVFSKEMSPGSLATSTFTVTKPGGTAIYGTVAYASGSVTSFRRTVSEVTLTI